MISGVMAVRWGEDEMEAEGMNMKKKLCSRCTNPLKTTVTASCNSITVIAHSDNSFVLGLNSI